MQRGSVWRDPRKLPVSIPEAGIFDEPNIKICLNTDWASHVDGVLGRLLEPDAWIGTDEEIEAAIQEVMKLQAILNPIGECEVLPNGATMWHDESLALGGQFLERIVDNLQAYNHFIRWVTPAINREFTNRFIIAAGNYQLGWLGITGAGSGILSVYVDDVLVTTIDFYNGSTIRNFSNASTAITLTEGVHVLRGKMASKHASSSGYQLNLTKLWLFPDGGD